MNGTDTWHTHVLQQLSQLFKDEPGARAFLATGSVADPELEPDAWSDLDMMVILTDQTVDRYYLSTSWLGHLGQIVGMERHEKPFAKVLRVCLEAFRRLDFVFIFESALESPAWRDQHLFHGPCLVLWSRIPHFAEQVDALPCFPEYRGVSDAELKHMSDEFWFKAAVAIAKVARNDLLVGLHLALDLARDSLVLQMIRRDRKMGTTSHRFGNWGNELLAGFAWDGRPCGPEKILELVRWSCETFDELASDLSSGYSRRGPLLFRSIELAYAAVGSVQTACGRSGGLGDGILPGADVAGSECR